MAAKAVRERLLTLQQALQTEADVLDRAFAVSVGTRELYDTILDPERTVELYTSLGSTNIRIAEWSKPEPITGVQFFATDKPGIALSTATFEMRSRPLQRYRADASNGGSYLVSSVEYLVLNLPPKLPGTPTTQPDPPRMFVLFRISQTPTQQYGDIMQLHEYITFYRAGRDADSPEVAAGDRDRLRAADRASMARTIVNYRPSIEYEGSKPVLHHLIKRIAIPSMRQSFADWVKALGPLAAQFRRHLMDLALKAHAEKEAKKEKEAGETRRMQEALEARASSWARGATEDVGGSDSDSDDTDADPDDDGGGGGDAGAGAGARRGPRRRVRISGSATAEAAASAAANAADAKRRPLDPEGVAIAAAAASRLQSRVQAARRAKPKRLTGEQRDAERFGKLSERLRSDADEYASDIRRLVYQHVSKGGGAGRAARRVAAATDDEAEEAAAAAAAGREEDPRAVGPGLDLATWSGALTSRGDDFGLLESHEFRRKSAGRDRCHLVLEHVGDEDLAARFWAQTFSRDCSIWPGAFAGDRTASSALDALMVSMADPADTEQEDEQEEAEAATATKVDVGAEADKPPLPSAAGSVGGQAVPIDECEDPEPRGVSPFVPDARPTLFDYIGAGLTARGGAASTPPRRPPAGASGSRPVARDPEVVAEAHAELLAGVLQSLSLSAGSALPADVRAMMFGGPRAGRVAAEEARRTRAALRALDATPRTRDGERSAALLAEDGAAGPSSATAESKDEAADGAEDDGKASFPAAAAAGGSAGGVAAAGASGAVSATPPELARILEAVDVLPPSRPDAALSPSPHQRGPGNAPASARIQAWLQQREGALDGSPPASGKPAFADRPASPPAADGYASGDAGGYTTEEERGGDFKPIGGGAFDPAKAMTPLQVLAERERVAADTAPVRDPAMAGSHRGDCTPADLPCSVM